MTQCSLECVMYIFIQIFFIWYIPNTVRLKTWSCKIYKI